MQIRDLYLYLFRRAIIVNGYVDDHTWRGIRHRNWGDDLNYYFIRQMTGLPVVMLHNFRLAQWMHLKNYLCIGTLLDGTAYKTAETIVWGSGCSGAERGLTHPKKVLSVRGPLSKKYLDRHGVACPKVYGDPALLLPLFYRPRVEKKYKLGVIPHVVDQQHPVVRELREKHADDVLVIDLAHYHCWTDVIDQICSCEKIASSSLHGLIVSDAYGVPNCWIELTGNVSGGYSKFLDYMASVKRPADLPVLAPTVEKMYYTGIVSAAREVIASLQEDLLRTIPFDVDIKNQQETVKKSLTKGQKLPFYEHE